MCIFYQRFVPLWSIILTTMTLIMTLYFNINILHKLNFTTFKADVPNPSMKHELLHGTFIPCSPEIFYTMN